MERDSAQYEQVPGEFNQSGKTLEDMVEDAWEL